MFYFPGAPPGIPPPPGKCPPAEILQSPPCRGLPPVCPAALLAGIQQKKQRPNRIQLSWVAEKSSPPPPSLPLSHDSYTSSCCIFSRITETEQTQIQSIILDDKELETQFTRKKVTAQPSIPKKKPAVPVHKGILPPATSQKFQIIVRCLKKAFDDDGWTACKKALLGCKLEKQEISLLLETIPEQGNNSSRKAMEWDEALTAIRKAQEADPNIQLQDDEDFISFMSSIPDLHTRLQCMLVMQSFDDLIAKTMREFESMMDAIEILVRSETLPKLFHAILTVGNFLNEGTALGNRKWFRMETLKRVEELRAPAGGKSLLYFLASRLGPVMTNTELATIERAAQLSLVMSIQSACHLQDVYNLLAASSSFDESQLMVNRADCEFPDEFSTVGRQFAIEHAEKFKALKDDARRLLVDYQSAVSYFGDVEYFLPFDKKVDDPKCPGQKRFVPDLFQVCSEFLRAYSAAVREVDLERDKKSRAKRRIPAATKMVDCCSSPGKRAREAISPTMPAPESRPAKENKSPIDSPKVICTTPAKNNRHAVITPVEPAAVVPTMTISSRRTSLRPSLFGNAAPSVAVLHNASSLQAVQELIADEEPPPTPVEKPRTSDLKKATSTFASRGKKSSWLSRGVNLNIPPPPSSLSKPKFEKDTRRRESLRAVSGYIRNSVHGTIEGRGSLVVDRHHGLQQAARQHVLASVAEENVSPSKKGSSANRGANKRTPPADGGVSPALKRTTPPSGSTTSFGSRLAMLRNTGGEPKRGGFLSRKTFLR